MKNKLIVASAIMGLAASGWASSTIDSTNHFAWGANVGWLDWRADGTNGAVIGQFYCSGYLYAANVGWISLGATNGPANGYAYANTGTDYGVNNLGSGQLAGLAWGANIGWIRFEQTYGQPRYDRLTGRFSGFIYSANCGWISLSNAQAFVQTDSVAPGPLDANGLPIAWEKNYFGTTGVDPNADPDHDGFSNRQEYFFGTNPTDPASPAVRDYLGAVKLKYYDQFGAGPPVLSATGFGFYAAVAATRSNAVTSATDRVPGGTLKNLLPDATSNDFQFSQFFVSQTALDAAYSNGVYTLNINTSSSDNFAPALTMPGAAYPNVPRVLNDTAAQAIDAAADFAVIWTNFVGGTTGDFISLEVDDALDHLVYQTPAITVSNRLNGTATGVLIPAGTLQAGNSYTGRLLFVKVTGRDTNSVPGAVGLTGYGAQTAFDLATAGGLWSSAADLGGGWKWLEWFGYFNTNADPWIYHLQHGWLYPVGTDTSSIFFWDNAMATWWWTSATTYPYVYRFSDSAWLWYQKDSTNPRWFYNLTAGKWESW